MLNEIHQQSLARNRTRGAEEFAIVHGLRGRGSSIETGLADGPGRSIQSRIPSTPRKSSISPFRENLASRVAENRDARGNFASTRRSAALSARRRRRAIRGFGACPVLHAVSGADGARLSQLFFISSA
jgi:hypothetical protein